MTLPRYALPSTETIHETVLQNGITVLVYENPAVESVVLYGSLLAGSIYDPLDRNGIASLTADALLRGTTTRDFETLNSALEDIGAELDTSTGKHRMTFSGRALVEDFTVLIDVLADALQNPIFVENELAEERLKRTTELNFAHQDTRYMATRGLRKALYPATHAYHYSTYGSVDSLQHITTSDLRRFHSQYYRPDGMTIVVVGAVSAQIATAIIADALGDWQNSNQSDLPIFPDLSPPQDLIRLDTSIAGKIQADIIIGTIGPSRFADDYIATQLANSILGEFGMMGRIGNVIREQLGLAYYAYSRLDGGEGAGAWSVTAGVAPENVDLTIEKARDEIRRLTTEHVSAEDLDDNQAYFTGRLPLRLESNYGLASTIHAMIQYNLGLDYLVGYREQIFSITRDDILNAAQHYFDADKLIISVAG